MRSKMENVFGWLRFFPSGLTWMPLYWYCIDLIELVFCSLTSLPTAILCNDGNTYLCIVGFFTSLFKDVKI